MTRRRRWINIPIVVYPASLFALRSNDIESSITNIAINPVAPQAPLGGVVLGG